MNLIGLASALANLMTSGALAIAGLTAFAMAILRPGSTRVMPPMLAFVAGVGLCTLAADEGLELHDRVGRWLWYEHGVAAPGPINHVDDVIVFLYLAAGAVIGQLSLPVLIRAPRFLAGLVAAAGLMALGTVFDALGGPGTWTEVPEEGLEAAGAGLAAAVFLLQIRREGVSLTTPEPAVEMETPAEA